MPSRELEQLVAMLRTRPRNTMLPSAEQLRSGFSTMTARLPPPANDVVFEPVDAGGVPGEWVSVPNSSKSHVLLYFHGGGYVFGSAAVYRDLVSRLCRAAGVRALSIDYRLAPESRFPAAVEDAVTAFRWLLSQGIQPNQIVLAGDSAGGGLALATLVALRDQGEVLPAAAVCMSPLTDHAREGDSMLTKAELDPILDPFVCAATSMYYLGQDGDMRTPLASPIYADLAGLPPILILVGTWEVLLDDSMRFAERAKAAGVDVQIDVWDGMIHEWPFFAAIIPEGREAIDQMGVYIRRRLD